MTFSEACAKLEAALQGTTRPEIVAATPSLDQLRSAIKAHRFQTASGTLSLRPVVDSLDARSRREGLHVMQAWDFRAHRFTDDPAPALLVVYVGRLTNRASSDHRAAAILLDVYFHTVLSLLAMRAWDEGDANDNLDRVTELLTLAQNDQGSGLRYVDDAETLLFLAAAYYHPDESAYGRLLVKVLTLDDRHRVKVARAVAAMLAAHLRWGLRYMYERDVGRMREDNVVDYPWLLFAVDTLLRAPDADEALLDALSADPWAFTGSVRPAVCDVDQLERVREEVRPRRDELLRRFETLQPKRAAYSPLSFASNFPSNAAVALATVTIEDDRAYSSMNALFTSEQAASAPPPDVSPSILAERLMKYAASGPQRLGAGGAPLIVYDPSDGARAWNAVVRELRGLP